MKISYRSDFEKISRTLVIDYYAAQFVSFEDRMEFKRIKKAIAVQGILGGSGSVTFIDKRHPVKYKKDFDRLYDALDEFKALAYELVVRENGEDRVADTIRKCNGE